MPSAAKFCFKEGVHYLLDQIQTQQPGTQAEHVRIVVLAGVVGRGIVVAHRRAHALHFVSCHIGANPGTVDHNPPPSLARGNLFSDRLGKIGIIHRFLAVSTAVIGLVAILGQINDQGALQLESTMVSADGDHLTGGSLLHSLGSSGGVHQL